MPERELIVGKTRSGKTEFARRAIKNALKRGHTVLIMETGQVLRPVLCKNCDRWLGAHRRKRKGRTCIANDNKTRWSPKNA